jgi:hypothetical protein
MNPQRKRIIISEILYWKKNKLLPEHYCDFLITLYAQGNEEELLEVKVSQSILTSEKKRLNRIVVFLSILAVVFAASMFVLINLPLVTIGMSTLLIVLLLLIPFSKTIKKSFITPFIYIICAFLLLATSMKVWLVYFEGESSILIALLVLNCVLWFFTGRQLKLLYFTISGAAGILLIIGFLFI